RLCVGHFLGNNALTGNPDDAKVRYLYPNNAVVFSLDCNAALSGISKLPEKVDAEESDLDDEAQYPHGLKLLIIIVALGMSIFLVALHMTIIATAIPKITDQFHSLDDASWYGSAFLMITGGFQSTWGKIYKFFPLKISFLLAVFIFELGSLICGVSPNSVTLIVGRVIAGVGAAGIGSGVFIIITFTASPKRRPLFTGIIGMSYGIASVVGPLLVEHSLMK
ncbi:uncharacterized protein N7443_007755, partial [Penicillium atrosanguineum]|uniref:uncharacterized protein n=1 Tax=Penicillium atrosanguineum TaxID=1132637 RepID=UPI0023A52714